MATTFSSFRTTTPSIVCSAAPHKPDPSSKNNASARSNNWWAPIFGWSSEPDYITSGAVKFESDLEGEKELGRARPDKKLFRGCFTEEKAKELRKRTTEISTFHDIMYHSAIASRLASDVSEL